MSTINTVKNNIKDCDKETVFASLKREVSEAERYLKGPAEYGAAFELLPKGQT